MRGGPLASKRVIDLVNRRFVPFYFNVGKRGRGYDPDAAAFIAGFDKRFSGSSVPTPPVWVISPNGRLLATINNYAPKARFFAALKAVLDKHPEFNVPAEAEKAALDAGASKDAKRGDRLAAARVLEELGEYEKAAKAYTGLDVVDGVPSGVVSAQALLGRIRIARHASDWDAMAKLLKRVNAIPNRSGMNLDDEWAMEYARLEIGRKQYAAAYNRLLETIKTHVHSKRLGEMHFFAGVCAFFLKKADWADFHWCWVMRNIPDDYNYMRCYLAATASAMPYPNPELGGYRGKRGMISHALADAARDRAMKNHDALKDTFDQSTAKVLLAKILPEEAADLPVKAVNRD